MATNLAWARKYRPSSFDDYLGEDVKNQVVRRFENSDNIPNTIMLYGTRGTGKTSMARLIAKEIQCLSPENGRSCGKCEMCQELNRYITSTEAGDECLGVAEINAASTNGKDAINEIIDDALTPPQPPANKKVLIFDECHMISKAAQNSILKITEEPPEHLVFILCTTEPDKVIEPLHSRMQMKIEVRKKSVDEIVDKLLYIAKHENITTSPQALRIIAKRFDRVPRECINKFEGIARNNNNSVTVADVQAEIGEVESYLYVEFYKCANLSLEAILEYSNKLKSGNKGIREFITGLIRFTIDTIYIKYGIAIEDYSPEQVKQAKQLFKMYTMSDCDMLLQIVESAANAIGDDDTKNELIIINTAVRVSKLKLLSQGLVGQASRAKDENIASIRKYSGIIGEEQEQAIERLSQQELRSSTIVELFPSATEVVGVKMDAEAAMRGEEIPLGNQGGNNSEENSDSNKEGKSGEDKMDMLRRLFQET